MEATSLAALIPLRDGQDGQMRRLYDGYASHRRQQEAKMEQWQSELQQAQSPRSLDERRVARLMRDINDAQAKVISNLLSARAKAIKALSPVQRARLDSLEAAGEERTRVRHDHLYHLLLMPMSQIEPLPPSLDERAWGDGRSRSARSQGRITYGAYGGYSYGGVHYGVGAHYGRGPIGVHAGIGRGGPSFGVSIGGVLGGWGR